MLQLFWKNATSKVVGDEHGVTRADLEGMDLLIRQAHAKVRSQVTAGRLGYAALPTNTEYRAQVRSVASGVSDDGEVVVAGALERAYQHVPAGDCEFVIADTFVGDSVRFAAVEPLTVPLTVTAGSTAQARIRGIRNRAFGSFGIVDVVGQPIAGAEIEVRTAAAPPLEVVPAGELAGEPAGSGRWEGWLAPGDYDVYVNTKGQREEDFGTRAEHVILSDASPRLVEVELLRRDASLEVRVTDEAGVPVAGIEVSIPGPRGPRTVARTGLVGTVQFERLVPGGMGVWIEASPEAPETIAVRPGRSKRACH